MGQKDTVTKSYMSKKKYFADAFNFLMFNGNCVVKEENLHEQDPTEIGIVFEEEEKEITQKVRDVLKECVIMQDDKCSYLILGIENQSDVHYAMPVKNLIYDALNYGQQISKKTKELRKEGKLKKAEFLSGIRKNEKLKPVITLTIYWGADEWDAPRCLKGMLEDVDKSVLHFVNDYKLNLIVPKEIDDFSKFVTDFGKAMKYIASSQDKQKMQEAAQNEKFRFVDVDTVNLLNVCTGANISVSEGEERIDMCKALEDIKNEGISQGVEIGIHALVKTLKSMDASGDFIVDRIVEEFGLSENNAKKYVQ